MKILQLFSRFPWPLKDGGAVAFYASLNGFSSAGNTVDAAVLNTSKHHIVFDELPENIKALANFHLYEINNDIHLKGLLSNIFRKESYIVSRFYDSHIEQKLIELVQYNEFDVILFESLQMAAYVKGIKQHTKAICLHRSHNVEHNIWLRQARIEKNLFKRLYLKWQAKKLAKFEKEIIHYFDGILPITQTDLLSFKALGYNKPMHVMASGIQLKPFSKIKPNHTGNIFHLGSMDWMPNQEGIRWFLNQCWPKIIAKNPSAQFTFAGRNMPQEFLQIQLPHVSVTGEVEDAESFMQHNGLMVVPLLSGSGMRIKVIEGMALGKCIVSTKIGMEGIEATAGKEFMEANTPDEFADKIFQLLSNENLSNEMGLAAQIFAYSHYNNENIISGVMQFIRELSNTKTS